MTEKMREALDPSAAATRAGLMIERLGTTSGADGSAECNAEVQFMLTDSDEHPAMGVRAFVIVPESHSEQETGERLLRQALVMAEMFVGQLRGALSADIP